MFLKVWRLSASFRIHLTIVFVSAPDACRWTFFLLRSKNMSFSAYLLEHVCYRRLLETMPAAGSLYQSRLFARYERGVLPSSHPFARQMRKLECLTKIFRYNFEHGGDCRKYLTCTLCIENGGF